MATVDVDVAFDDGPLTANPTWHPLAEVKQISIQRGRQTSIGRIEAGRCTVILGNQARRYDPTNTSSSEYGSGSRLIPGKRVRVRVTTPLSWQTTNYLFTGNVIGWYQEYDEQGMPLPDLRLEAVDAFGYFGTQRLTTTLPIATVYDRFEAILDLLDWPPAWRYILASGVDQPFLGAATYNDANALEALQQTASAERGALFMSGDGLIYYQAGRYRTADTPNPIFWTFGAGGGEQPYKRATIVYDRSELYNDVRITPNSGVVQTAAAPTNGQFFINPYAASVPLLDDGDALILAQQIANRYQLPQQRISQLGTAQSLHEETYWQFMLDNGGGIDIGTRIGINLTPPTGASISVPSYVEGLRHDIPSTGIWQLTYQLSPAVYYAGWVLGSPTYSLLSQSTFTA